MHSATALHDAIKKISNNIYLSGLSTIIMGVTKGQGSDAILMAAEAGLIHFGENRVQEAMEKWPAIKNVHPHLQLHLIGPLQTNKVKQAMELFDVIQTIDRPKLAEAIAHELEQHPSSRHRFFVQVNIGREPQKSGIMPAEADALIRYCREDLRLNVVGLMCVPPHDNPPAPYFALLKGIAGRNGLKELSMGMSDDYETALRMGSTCIRLGRILFGERLG